MKSLGHMTSYRGFAENESKKMILLHESLNYTGQLRKQYLALYPEPIQTLLDEAKIDKIATNYVNTGEVFDVMKKELPEHVETTNEN